MTKKICIIIIIALLIFATKVYAELLIDGVGINGLTLNVPSSPEHLLLESGDFFLLETGDKLLLQ